MAGEIITDPRLQIGANRGPPLEDDRPTNWRYVAIAARALNVICSAIEKHPRFKESKKQYGDALSIRNLWLWAMQNGRHIPNNVLAEIAQLNRKTVTGYVQQLETHGERNGLLRGFFDQIADLCEPIPGIVDDAEEALADMALEASIDRVRKSTDALDISRPADRIAKRA